jgi:hypothetical protein
VDFSLALTINPISQVTTALIFGLSDLSLLYLINKIQKAKHLASTPFLLPLYLEAMAIENSQDVMRATNVCAHLADIAKSISVRKHIYSYGREDSSISPDENQKWKRNDLTEVLGGFNGVFLDLDYVGRRANVSSSLLNSLVMTTNNYMDENKLAGSDYT